MIVGATAATDADLLQTSSSLYAGQSIKRVYFSAFSPDPRCIGAAPAVGASPAPRAPAVSG